MTARHLPSNVFYKLLSDVRDPDQYTIGFGGPSARNWRETAPIGLPHASASMVYWPLAQERVGTGGDIRCSCIVLKTFSSSLIRL